MQTIGKGLAALEAKFFAYMQMKNQEIVRIGELQEKLNISSIQETKLLSRLSKKGLLVRIKRGLYLVPKKLPAGKWMPSEYTAIAEYMASTNAQYFISGPTAFHHYGLIEQIPNQLTVYNDKISGRRKVGIIEINFIEISTERIGSFKKITIDKDRNVNIASLPRAIVDALYDWKRFKTIPKAFEWIKKYKGDKKILDEFIDVVLNFSNMSTMRRVGYYLEYLKSDQKLVAKIYKKISPTSSYIPFLPNKPKIGITNKKWGLVINE